MVLFTFNIYVSVQVYIHIYIHIRIRSHSHIDIYISFFYVHLYVYIFTFTFICSFILYHIFLLIYMFICIKQLLKLNWTWNTLPELTASAQRQLLPDSNFGNESSTPSTDFQRDIFLLEKKQENPSVSSARLLFGFSTNEWLIISYYSYNLVTWGPMVAPDENLQVCDTNDGQNPAPLQIQERSSAAKMSSIMCCAQCLQKGTWFSWVLPKQTFCGGSYLPTQNVRNHLRHRER